MSFIKIIRLFLLIVLLLTIFALSGCVLQNAQGKDAADGDAITVTDMLGRKLDISVPVERVVAVGPGALRLYCYINGSNMVAGIEQMDKENPVGRPYLMANSQLSSLPVIGPGGPNNAPDSEKILTVQPDIIFSMYTTDPAAVDELQNKTGIPVVALSYGQVSAFDPDIYTSLRLIGEIVDRKSKAEEVIAYMEAWSQDLDNRTKIIPEELKPLAYVGGLGARGAHGIESTQGNYSLFNAVNARNAVDEIGHTGSLMIDKEQLIQWNPDKIFIDLGGYAMFQEDYRKNTSFYKALSAIENGDVYSQLPYNYYNTNIETAIANAYYIGKVLYPKHFEDIVPEEKADEIYQFLLNKPLYAQMAKDFGGFMRLTFP